MSWGLTYRVHRSNISELLVWSIAWFNTAGKLKISAGCNFVLKIYSSFRWSMGCFWRRQCAGPQLRQPTWNMTLRHVRSDRGFQTRNLDFMCPETINTGLFEMIFGVLTTYHTQYTWDRSICIFFLFNRITLQVFVTYLIGALYVHRLWFYKHQHDNRVRSILSVACQRWWFQWRLSWWCL